MLCCWGTQTKSKRRLVDQKHKGEQTYPRGLPDKGKRYWYEIVPDLPNEGLPTIGNGAEFPHVKDPASLVFSVHFEGVQCLV